jgi:threonine aldolase
LIEIENTHNKAGGTIQPMKEIEKISKIAKKYKLKMHLAGARLWNAHIAAGVELKRYTQYFDSVTCCLSKGLGAPVGSVIAGSKKFIKEAYRVRKGWGGGMRQAGFLAAAGLFALENNINRLSEDHEKAKQLARGLNEIKGIEVDPDSVQTNIVMFKLKKKKTNKFLISLSENGVKMIPGSHDKVRAVTHMDVSFADMFKTLEIINVVIDS